MQALPFNKVFESNIFITMEFLSEGSGIIRLGRRSFLQQSRCDIAPWRLAQPALARNTNRRDDRWMLSSDGRPRVPGSFCLWRDWPKMMLMPVLGKPWPTL